jgi:hypothetical protein
MPHADIVKACEDAAKEAVLNEKKLIKTDNMKKALLHRHRQIK